MAPSPPPPEPVERFRRGLEALDDGGGPLGVAVSGGPDSLALLLLAAEACPGRVRAATVDHGLRAESADEARQVASICGRMGIKHAILNVAVPAGGEGVQGEARRARYEALGGWMEKEGISNLLTAHHCDDQAETLLMRLLRGSGVGGLAAVRAALPFPGRDGRILRPLLGWRRAELAAIVAAAGLEAVDDPSNRDEAYDRARIRRRMGEAGWLDPAAIARSAASLAEAEEALEWMAAQLAARHVEEKEGAVLLAPEGVPAEMLRRLVLLCLRRIAPEASPRGDGLSALIRSLRSGATATLAGVKCSGGAHFRFEPAPPRRAVRPAGPKR